MCTELLRVVESSTARRVEISLGSWDELLQNTCPNHASLFPSEADLFGQNITIRKPSSQRLVYIQPNPFQGSDFSAALDGPWEPYEPNETSQLFSQSSAKCSPRIIDPAWISVQFIKDWVSECLMKHEGTCATPPNHTKTSILLIDTNRKCLVSSNTAFRYVTFSYVWGQGNKFMTMSANLELLSTPGIFDQPDILAKIPKTIKQAIDLTRELGEKYLWVDALCIVQDGLDKNDQLNAMSSIFANAVLTIVAADGQDAQAGFRGLRDISEPRKVKQRIAHLLPRQYLVKPSSKQVWDDSVLKPWSTRAWTFQEAIFSRRIVYFAHEGVRWSCQQARWSEESDSPSCLTTYGTVEQQRVNLFAPRISPSKLPQLSELESLINAFNCRQFTYPEDVLSAFAGVSSELGNKFDGGLISGLPELFFDLCLLWQPLRRLGPALRRTSKTENPHHCLPSWSWAGWITEVTWPYTWNRTGDAAAPPPVLIGNIKPFYQADFSYIDMDGVEIRIKNRWLSFAEETLNCRIPSRWSKHNIYDKSEIRDYDGITKAHYFSHESDGSTQFYFPVPLCNENTPPRAIHLIKLRTMSSFFKLGESRRSATRIHTIHGEAVGTLWQHNEADREFVQATSENFENRSTIELVTVIGATIPVDIDHVWDIPDATPEKHELSEEPPVRSKDVYNAIWIRRAGDVAYRVATGEVDRLAWDKSDLQWVDVTLG